jgi:hypothetical protein
MTAYTLQGADMTNPIPRNGMFATPDSLDALQEYVSQFNGSELRAALVVMMMTMNLCNKIVEETVDAEQV